MSFISAVIPALNAARYLREALESVHAQTHPVDEVIVVDNGSTDGTPELAAALGAKVEHEARRGAAYARNRGIEVARGNFIALLDADDLWMPRKLEWQMKAFKATPELEAVFGQVEQFLSPDLLPAEAALLHCPADPMPARALSLALVRRSAMDRIGLFAPEFPLGDMVEWSVRAEAMGLRSVTLPQVLSRRRLHGKNMGCSMRDQRSDYVRIIKQKLDRERVARGVSEAR